MGPGERWTYRWTDGRERRYEITQIQGNLVFLTNLDTSQLGYASINWLTAPPREPTDQLPGATWVKEEAT